MFCYICGDYTFVSQKSSMAAVVEKAYHLYFGCEICDQDKEWVPQHLLCHLSQSLA